MTEMPVGFQLAKRLAQSVAERFGLAIHSTRYLGHRNREYVLQIDGALRALGVFTLPFEQERLDLLGTLLGTSVSEGLYICQRLKEALAVPGDACEFGVAQGATSALLANELKATARCLWLYDSFVGLPAPSKEDVLIHDIFGLGSMDAYRGEMKSPESMVRRRLARVSFPQDRYRIVRGFFENSPTTPGPQSICFAYVDFDLYKSILDALDFIDNRMPVGGRVVVDDYGFFSAGAQQAVDEFRARRSKAWEFSLPYDFAGHFCCLRKIA